MWATYNSAPPRRTASIGISLILHGILIVCLCWRPTPQFVRTSSLRLGEGGSSITPIYLARRGAEELLPAAKASASHASALQYSKARHERRHGDVLTAQNDVQNPGTAKPGHRTSQGAQAGSPYGSLTEGSIVGEEVKPALPLYGPQPQIASYEIPSGLEGDIVVEITIDAYGNVTETSLLRGLGHGLDEKVMAVLPTWHFHPATRDGVPIPSRQDVYFHFPRPA